MNLRETATQVKNGQASLGIELGSTRIKAVLINPDFETISSGSYTWENQLKDGIWTYPLDQVWEGIQAAYAKIKADVQSKYHVSLDEISSIGVSAMMHGYLPFDKNNQLLVPFRTWRNNITEESADKLTDLFDFNIPQRWSIAHLYQAILNKEPHVKDVDFITTLAGYVHWKLSGEKVLGIGDASGVFPIDDQTLTYRQDFIEKFNSLPEVEQYPWQLKNILPAVLVAGRDAGHLTADGAKLVGTSAFSMNVLDAPLKKLHRDIDIVTTPTGDPVAMVHINNCSSDINAWVGLFRDFANAIGAKIDTNTLYETLFDSTVHSDPDAGGLINYSYLSGENITKIQEGRPLFVRTPNSKMNLANFFLTQLYAAFAPLKVDHGEWQSLLSMLRLTEKNP